MKWPWRKKSKPNEAGTSAPVAAEKPTPSSDVDVTTHEPNRAPESHPLQSKPVAPAVQSLTPRERDVFELLIQGRKLKEIADALGIQYSTVNSHQKAVYKKLGVTSRAECILRYGMPGGERE